MVGMRRICRMCVTLAPNRANPHACPIATTNPDATVSVETNITRWCGNGYSNPTACATIGNTSTVGPSGLAGWSC